MIRTTWHSLRGRDRTKVPIWILLREQSIVLILGMLFLLGVGIGAMVGSRVDSETAQNILTVLGQFLRSRRDQTLAVTFFSALAPNLGLLLLLTACGFCAVSAPIIVLIPCFRGLGFGLMASTMLIQYGGDAAGCLCILVLPNLIWSTVILLFCCRDALRLSRTFWNAMVVTTAHSAQPIRSGAFGARCILYTILLAAGAAAETYLFFLFAGILLPI